MTTSTCDLKEKAARQVAQECRTRMANAKVAAVWLAIGKDLVGLHAEITKITPRGDHHAGWQKAFTLKMGRKGRPAFPFSRVMADRYIAVHEFFVETAVSAKTVDGLPASFRALEAIAEAKMSIQEITAAIESEAINPFADSTQVRDYAISLGLAVKTVPVDEPPAPAASAAEQPVGAGGGGEGEAIVVKDVEDATTRKAVKVTTKKSGGTTANPTNDWRGVAHRTFNDALNVAREAVRFGKEADAIITPELQAQIREELEPLKGRLSELTKGGEALLKYVAFIKSILPDDEPLPQPQAEAA